MENEKSSNSKLIIAFMIVVAAIVAVGLVASNKITENKKKESENQQEKNDKGEENSENNGENSEVLKVISKEEAYELLSKYHADTYFQYKEGLKESLKQYLALKNSSSIEVKNCADIYDMSLTESDNQIAIGELTYCCTDTTQVISYDEINESYKSLFGSKNDISKTNFQYLTNVYNYIEEIDSFSSVIACEDEYIDSNIEIYNINDIEVINNKLVISVNYIEFESAKNENGEEVYTVNVGGQDVKIIKEDLVDEEGNIKTETTDKFFKDYDESLPIYTYIFEKENDDFILVDFKL